MSMQDFHKLILAVVGMPGSGKSETVKYLQNAGISCIRFGEYTEEILERKKLPITLENEQKIREEIREKFGMRAYAVHSFPKIQKVFEKEDIVAIDGLYSWDEYMYLRKKPYRLILVHIFTEKNLRYSRLEKRPQRSLQQGEAEARDIAEIENLGKGGPIAIADYIINNSGSLENLQIELESLIKKIGAVDL